MFTTLFRSRAESKEHKNRKKDETFISEKSNQTLIFRKIYQNFNSNCHFFLFVYLKIVSSQ